jgi:Secretion system C-terminal sorting domain
MKQTFVFLFLLSRFCIIAQNYDAKRDYIWRSGLGFNTVQATRWDFNKSPTQIDSVSRKHGNSGAVGMISNTNGAFLLFSNGCYLVDKNDSIIQNSNNMNAGSIHTTYCPPNDDGYLTAPMSILPYPKDTNSFMCFHTRVQSGFHNEADALLVTKLTKNIREQFTIQYIDSVLIRDVLERGHLAVCRHGNGRDWWIIHPQKQSNQYHKILFSPFKFEKNTQSIGVSSTAYENTGGQAVFSPDGTKYVRYNIQSDIRIFDFDRCSGQLSNPIQIPILDAADTIGFAGCAISANSRFLYIISTNNIYQFDLQASNIGNSKITVLTYDNYEEPARFNIRFGCGLLGADGKIYVTSNLARRFLHLIEYPDSAGLACKAVQRKYRLVNSIYDQLPIFPNYRLGASQGSACDTLSASQEPYPLPYHLKLYPNPAVEDLGVDITLPTYNRADTKIEVFDMVGRQVYVTQLPPFTAIHHVDVSSFASGVYLVCLKVNNYPVMSKKVTILH